MLLAIALRRPRHVLDLQILNTYERVVLAERGTGLMQEILSGVRDSGVKLLNFSLRLFPVIAEFDFTTHASLIACKSLLVRLETIQWRKHVATLVTAFLLAMQSPPHASKRVA